MEVGKKYLAIQPANSFGEIEGELVEFEEKRIEIEVLPKPEQVIVCDGEAEVYEPLPDHLKQDDWYYVRNLKSGNTHWLNKLIYQISVAKPNIFMDRQYGEFNGDELPSIEKFWI